MIYNTFYSHNLKCEVKQINVKTAKNLFDNGKELFLKPSNLIFDSVLFRPMNLQKVGFNDRPFENVVNEFMYYNCDNERGKYIQYFVRVKDLS